MKSSGTNYMEPLRKSWNSCEVNRILMEMYEIFKASRLAGLAAGRAARIAVNQIQEAWLIS